MNNRIIGIGLDAVNIERIQHWLTVPGLPERFFNPEELKNARSRGRGCASSLAARFAAKEAFGKALGIGLKSITLKDILVVNDNKGKPYLKLFDTALLAFNNAGASFSHLSITHEKKIALAIVIIEKAI